MRRPGFSTIDAQNWWYEHDEDGTDPDDERDDAVDVSARRPGFMSDQRAGVSSSGRDTNG